MPAAPEVGDAVALVWRVEVERKVEAQQQGDADGHVAVATEVAVDLHGITIHTQQIFEATVESGVVEDSGRRS